VRTVREALQNYDHSPTTGVSPSIPGTVRFEPPLLDEHGAAIRRHGWRVFSEKSGNA
jgi:hypothetical protein